jgi:hypothetical protein
MRKGFTMTGIIVAMTIALVFLFMFAVLLGGRFDFFKKGVHGCEAQQGTCVASADDCDYEITAHDCPKGRMCCIRPP